MTIPFARLAPYPADRERPSPNHGPRAARHTALRLIVLHATAGSDEGAEAWMCNPTAQASAHLHVRRDGSTTRLVEDHRRAWHAGEAEWKGETDVNGCSLGVEIGNRNDGREAYTDAQYAAVGRIVAHYVRQGLARDAVVSHAAVGRPVGRKVDPVGWDWTRMWYEVDAVLAPPAPLPPPVYVEPRVPEIPRPAPTVAGVPVPPTSPPYLQPITVPPVPARVSGTIDGMAWARGVAREIGREAAERVEAVGRAYAEVMLYEALKELRARLSAIIPPWLLLWLWRTVEREARDALARALKAA